MELSMPLEIAWRAKCGTHAVGCQPWVTGNEK